MTNENKKEPKCHCDLTPLEMKGHTCSAGCPLHCKCRKPGCHCHTKDCKYPNLPCSCNCPKPEPQREDEKFNCPIHHLYCRCMNLNGQCPNQHYADCLKKCQPPELPGKWEEEFEKLYLTGDLGIDLGASENAIPLRGLKDFIRSELTAQHKRTLRAAAEIVEQISCFCSTSSCLQNCSKAQAVKKILNQTLE